MKWNPYQKFTWTRRQLNEWIAENGRCAFYDGVLWEVQSKRIANSSFLNVWFTETKDI